MKKIYSLTSIGMLLFCANISAQWCTPTTAIPYDANMPGVTHYICNTINRTSAACENYPNNNYVLATNTTTLTRGSAYNVSITFTIDASICPDMNLRVWIDYNQDGQLDDPGETVVTANNQLPGTYSASITIPATATLGSTRMRVTAKMTSNGGHTLPTPCDNPADPLGYHGEFEDYNVTISAPTGIDQVNDLISSLNAVPNPGTIDNTVIHYSLANASPVNITMTNIAGQTITLAASENPQVAGDHYISLTDVGTTIPSGIYLVSLNAGNQRQTMRIVILNE
ncbi:MAG: T9SS type A sorting domain-containing protein [Bacteroidetes bacterium]|nr:T9SS type A sorting domain-containing protein [Bacteroidota bacterium]